MFLLVNKSDGSLVFFLQSMHLHKLKEEEFCFYGNNFTFYCSLTVLFPSVYRLERRPILQRINLCINCFTFTSAILVAN